MKRLWAGCLALMMILGLCLTSYAGPYRDQTYPELSSKASVRRIFQIETAGYLANEDGIVIVDLDDGEGDRRVDKVAPGETVYYKLKTEDNSFVSYEPATSGVTITQDWSVGNNLIDKIEIVQKKFRDRSETDYCYMLAITVKSDITSDKIQDAMGTITLKKTSGTDSGASSGRNSLAFTLAIRFFFEIGYEEGNFTEIPKKPMVYLTEGSRGTMEFGFEDCENCTLEMDISGSDRILLGANSDYVKSIEDRYPGAELIYFNGSSSTFNKTATLRLGAPQGSYLYKVSSSNKLTAYDAPYSSDDGAFIIETKTLGRFIVSDIALDASGASDVSGSSDVIVSSSSTPEDYSNVIVEQNSVTQQPAPDYSGSNKVNPGTGAAA